MNHDIRRLPSFRKALLAVAFLFGANELPAQDAVETLREDLRRTLPLIGAAGDSREEALKFRQKKIQEDIDRLKDPGELHDALVLDEWKVDPADVVEEDVKAVDIELRRALGERFKKELDKDSRGADSTDRIAVAAMICEMGPTVRSLTPTDTGGFTRGLEPLIARLCKDPDVGVREQALRALGNINGPPKEVAETFRSILEKDADLGPKRLAAEGLNQMMLVAAHLYGRQQTPAGVVASRKDVTDTLEAIMPVAAVGVKDGDSQVRMLALQAVQKAAVAMAELLEVPGQRDKITTTFSRRLFPPPGRDLTPDELKSVNFAYQQAHEDIAKVKPLIDSLRKEVLVYAQGLQDPEPRVKLAACQAFEALANARLKLVRRANALPTFKSRETGAVRSPAELLKAADFLQPVLDREMTNVIGLLRDPDVQIRLSAATALEQLEEKAAPAMAGLIMALRDPNRFVRWEAAKTLGFMPPEKAEPVILPLAQLLSDPALSVRMQAALSLEALGSVAQAAVPALAQSLTNKSGDVEARLAAMYALMKIGPAHLQPALPALIGLLSDRDPRVVRTACQVIAEIGPLAEPAKAELRRLIGHEDAEVRLAAAKAILSIRPRN
jgi:HEAT repeat protein